MRGYSEGLLLGKSGYFASAELVAPIFLLPKKLGTKKRHINLRDSVRGAVFVDHGAAFPYKGPGGRIESSDFLTSVGVGLRVNFSDNLNARFYWGFPLSNNPFETDQRSGRFHFEVTTSPDLTRLKSHPKAKKQRQTL